MNFKKVTAFILCLAIAGISAPVLNSEAVTTSEFKGVKSYILSGDMSTVGDPSDVNGDGVINVFDAIQMKYEDINALPSSHLLSGFVALKQSPELPTGCEATGLTVALNWYGFDVDKVDIAMTYMPRMDFYYSNGKLIGADFMTTFAGNPSLSNGYGCYAPCLVQTAKNYFAAIGSSYSAKDISGTSLTDLFRYVADGTPVVLISSPNLATPVTGSSWYTPDGRYVTWQKNHHCMVLIGYDLNAGTVTVADSMKTKGIVSYNIDEFERIYDLKGRSAMIILPDGSANQPSTPAPAIVNNGVYCLKNAGSGKYLNVHMGYDTNGTNVYQWTKDGSDEQMFKVQYISSAVNAYYIRAMCSSDGGDKVLDIEKSNKLVVDGCNVEIYSAVDPVAQQWQIINLNDGTFKIVPLANTSLALTVADGSNGTSSGRTDSSSGNAFVGDYTGSPYQKWYFELVN